MVIYFFVFAIFKISPDNQFIFLPILIFTALYAIVAIVSFLKAFKTGEMDLFFNISNTGKLNGSKKEKNSFIFNAIANSILLFV